MIIPNCDMNFLDKLDYLMDQNNLNKHSLSKISGIPYTTIDAFYKKGYDNAKLSTLKKLANQFSTTIDYLMRDEITDIFYGMHKNALPISNQALKVAKAFDRASYGIQESVCKLLDVSVAEGVLPSEQSAG